VINPSIVACAIIGRVPYWGLNPQFMFRMRNLILDLLCLHDLYGKLRVFWSVWVGVSALVSYASTDWAAGMFCYTILVCVSCDLYVDVTVASGS
jgi:hypothetical protein